MEQTAPVASEQEAPPTSGFEHTDTTGLDIANERREQQDLGQNEVELPKPASEAEFEVPEKFKGKSLEDVIKSYGELEKKLSTSRPKDAPQDYEIELSENLEKAGVDFDLEDPALNRFAEIAKDVGMSNEKFNEILNLYGESYLSNSTMSEEQITEYRRSEMEKLGEEGPAIVEQLKNWGKNNLSEADYDMFIQFGDSADSIKFLQKLINSSSSPTVSPSGSNLNYTRDDLKAMMADKRYSQDLSYTRKVDALFREVYERSQGVS